MEFKSSKKITETIFLSEKFVICLGKDTKFWFPWNSILSKQNISDNRRLFVLIKI